MLIEYYKHVFLINIAVLCLTELKCLLQQRVMILIKLESLCAIGVAVDDG